MNENMQRSSALTLNMECYPCMCKCLNSHLYISRVTGQTLFSPLVVSIVAQYVYFFIL